jgi:hypothetical protein
MKHSICIIGLLNCLWILNGQTRVIYHEYRPTDSSDTPIVQWDISSDSLPRWYIKESIDNHGRVIALQFYNGRNLNDYGVCGFIPWIKFEYPNDTTIIQSFLDTKGKFMGDLECGNPSQVKYHLSRDKKFILSSRIEIFIDTISYLKRGYTMDKIIQLSNNLKNETIVNEINYYSMSKAKLNSIFPVVKDSPGRRYKSN